MLGGFRALLAGGLGMLVLTMILRPVFQQEDCSNHGAAGNASAYGDGQWDVRYPLLMLARLLAVLIEQVLPITWRHRSGLVVTGRVALAVTAGYVFACCPPAWFSLVCR